MSNFHLCSRGTRRAIRIMTATAGLLLLTAAGFAQQAQAPAPRVEQWSCYCGASTPLFDTETRLKGWTAPELPGAPADRAVAIQPAVRKDYKLTGEKKPAVPAVRASAEQPVFDLDFGQLAIGVYAVRVVAMARTEDIEQYRRPLYLDLKVDGPQPASARQRIPYWDDFYAVTELYFLVDRPGAYQGRLAAGKGSMVDLYVHSIELHDVLKGLPGKAAKTRTGLFTPAERETLRRNAKPVEVRAAVAKWNRNMDPLWTDPARTLDPQQRAARDEALWNAFLPVNAQYIGYYPEGFPRGELTSPTSPAAKKAITEFGPWEMNVPVFGAVLMRNAKLNLQYTLDDLANHRPLPDPWPLKDDGGAAYLPQQDEMAHAENYALIASALQNRYCALLSMLGAWDGNDIEHRVPYLYHALGNRNAARDAALLLCRWAYLYPTISDAMVIDGALIAPAGKYNRDLRLKVHFLNEGLDGLQQGLATSYDYLFDFIQGNEELAQAVGRFVPWVKTEADVRALIETRVLQFGAKQSMRFHIFNDKESPTFLMRTAAVQQDPEVTRPWMEFLWSRTWVYPHARAGLPDYFSTTTQRDGSTDIGSVFYSQSGSPFLELALMTHRYVLNGGDPAYDMADLQRYGKAAEACRFPLAASVAGYPLSIGDVGGPAKPRIFQTFMQGLEPNFRAGARLTGDPALAWVLVNYYGRGGESDAEWNSITVAAAKQSGNPFLGQPSRVLANWAGILETGQEAQDFRFVRAAMLRVGAGVGHQHDDTLDLQVIAHGVRAANDVGWRGGYSQPQPTSSQVHNLVEVDEKGWMGHAWVAPFAPTPGAQYQMASAVPPANQQAVTLRTREVALINVDDGTPGVRPPSPLPYTDKTRFDPKAVTPNSYVFDVQRVSGGSLHTFCFHGTISDEFDPGVAGREVTDAQEQSYLRRFLQGPGMKAAGTAPDVLQATWRLRRTEQTLSAADRDGKPMTLKLGMGESYMQGAAYDPDSPPKYTRLHLVGRAHDRVLTAWLAPTTSNPEMVTWPFLFVQKRGANLESVYPSIIEPYAGKPFISAVRLAPVPFNEADALRAVAVEVTTVNGHKDLCFSDGRARTRQVEDVRVTGRFAFVSRDEKGLRLATLVEGTELATPWGTLKLEKPGWTAPVAGVDYWTRKVTLAGDWSDAALAGEQVEFGNPKHRTSYTVTAAAREGNQTVLTLDKALDLSFAHVISSDPARRLVVVNLGPTAQYNGMNDGLTCTNADNSRSWKCAIVGGDAGNYRYQLSGDFTADDFPKGGVFRLWEFGPGDTARLAARAAVRRLPDGAFRTEGNVRAIWAR